MASGSRLSGSGSPGDGRGGRDRLLGRKGQEKAMRLNKEGDEDGRRRWFAYR